MEPMPDTVIDKARKQCGWLPSMDWEELYKSLPALTECLQDWAKALQDNNFDPAVACPMATKGTYSWGELTESGRESWVQYAAALKEAYEQRF